MIESGDIRKLRALEPNPLFEVHALVGQLAISLQRSAISGQPSAKKAEG